jgi:hypothetical protein
VDRAVENDRAAIVDVGSCGLNSEEDGRQIGLDDDVECIKRRLADTGGAAGTGISKQDIELAKCRHGLFDSRIDRFHVSQIGLQWQQIGTERGGRFLQRLSASPSDRDLRAFRDKPPGRCEPNTTIATRDKGDLAIQSHRIVSATFMSHRQPIGTLTES